MEMLRGLVDGSGTKLNRKRKGLRHAAASSAHKGATSADDVWLVLDHETAHGAAVDAAQVASHGARSTDHRVGYAAQVGRSYPYLDMGTLKYQSDKSRWTHGKLLGSSGKPWEPLTNKAAHSHSVRHADRVVHPRAFARKLEAREGLNRTLTPAQAKREPSGLHKPAVCLILVLYLLPDTANTSTTLPAAFLASMATLDYYWMRPYVLDASPPSSPTWIGSSCCFYAVSAPPAASVLRTFVSILCLLPPYTYLASLHAHKA
ncbi:hypothetical protein M441DRAFT_42704 [Trichoderma asperellum CBS 433.97]|uniref:Uncharacterized protein n=1 Tax=Trichoderma asperellum (strain ATCC 204424 / CBS 433.97 / NBRC 101777) TaxID=1042311 RepID=A0A2T3ZQ88_TRIA4|nr:hypothetical protein M441DRAFT_42704 [Trichoderma asperellum CBS 433.97]PTB46965.1 hypothetical protein M441DRAFT_42704 [Trichoderma asperellum CBS 433.97]